MVTGHGRGSLAKGSKGPEGYNKWFRLQSEDRLCMFVCFGGDG